MRAWVIQKRGFVGDLNACLGVAYKFDTNPRIIFNDQIEKYASVLEFIDLDQGQQRPELLIASYQFSTEHMIAISRTIGEKPFLINLRDPGSLHSHFDLIANPRHAPRLSLPNVMETIGLSNTITPEKINSSIINLPKLDTRMKAAVLMGGDSIQLTNEKGGGKFKTKAARSIGAQINEISKAHDIGLYLTNSHRTREKTWEAFLQELSSVSKYTYDYSSSKFNPYLGMISLADLIIVTADSMSMCSEACSSGKPVYFAGLNRVKNQFLRSDHERLAVDLMIEGYARPLEYFDPEWQPKKQPLNVAEKIANRAKEILVEQRAVPVKQTRYLQP